MTGRLMSTQSPKQILFGQFAQQPFVMVVMNKRIVIGELDEWAGPNRFDGANLGYDFLYGFELVARCQKN